jgi:hypothetical protein
VNLYIESSVDNAYGDRLTKRGGFLTTSKTKPLIIDNLAALLRQSDSGIADMELVAECRTYVIDDKGATNAQSGCYDDRLMAYAIALHGLTSLPRPRERKVAHRFSAFDPTVGY